MTKRNLTKSLLFNTCLLGTSVFAASSAVAAMDQYGQSSVLNVTANNAAEVKSLHQFATRGDVTAQLALARYYENHHQPDRGGKWYKRAALNGNAEAQFQYGLMCLDEEVDCKDRDEGIFWVEQAAAQGHHQASVVADSLSKEDFTFGC